MVKNTDKTVDISPRCLSLPREVNRLKTRTSICDADFFSPN